MFSRSQRINSREFTLIYNSGKKYFSPFFRFIVNTGSFKVAVVVPKKKIKKRVNRNKEKRRIMNAIREIFKNNYPQLNIIIFLQKDTQNLSFNELVDELYKCIKKTDK